MKKKLIEELKTANLIVRLLSMFAACIFAIACLPRNHSHYADVFFWIFLSMFMISILITFLTEGETK